MTWHPPIHLPGGKGLIVNGKFAKRAEDCCCESESESISESEEPSGSEQACLFCHFGSLPLPPVVLTVTPITQPGDNPAGWLPDIINAVEGAYTYTARSGIIPYTTYYRKTITDSDFNCSGDLDGYFQAVFECDTPGLVLKELTLHWRYQLGAWMNQVMLNNYPAGECIGTAIGCSPETYINDVTCRSPSDEWWGTMGPFCSSVAPIDTWYQCGGGGLPPVGTIKYIPTFASWYLGSPECPLQTNNALYKGWRKFVLSRIWDTPECPSNWYYYWESVDVCQAQFYFTFG